MRRAARRHYEHDVTTAGVGLSDPGWETLVVALSKKNDKFDSTCKKIAKYFKAVRHFFWMWVLGV